MKYNLFGKTAAVLALGVMVSFLGPQRAEAALIANATTFTGGFNYAGLGESSLGSDLGTGLVTFGDCAFNGVNTICTISGAYTEAPTSTNNPGDTGTFTFQQIYSGNGPSPVIGRSDEPFSDIFNLTAVGDAVFQLTVTTSGGQMFSGIFPDDPFSNSIGFFGELDPMQSVCTGLAAIFVCSIGQVGLTPGSTIAGVLGSFAFSIPEGLLPPSQVPIPAALPLMAAGLAALGFAGRRRKKKIA